MWENLPSPGFSTCCVELSLYLFLHLFFPSLAKRLCTFDAVEEDETLKMTCYLTSGALMHEYCKKKDHTCLAGAATVSLPSSIRLAFLIGCSFRAKIQNQVTTNQRRCTDFCRVASTVWNLSVQSCGKEVKLEERFPFPLGYPRSFFYKTWFNPCLNALCTVHFYRS